jgi:hypothetical protein
VIAALLLLAAGCGGGEEGSGSAVGRFVTARTSLTPNVHLFAEPVVAGLDVIVDGDELDARRIRVKPDFRPYEIVGTVSRKQEAFDGLTRIRYRFTLRCLLIECIPPVLQSAAGPAESGRGDRCTYRFKPADVLYETPDAKPRLLRQARWPTLESVSRINASSIPRFGFAFRWTVVPLPKSTYRASPTLLGAALLGGSLLLLALPAGLGVAWLRRRRPPPPEPEPELPPLERALRLVEWARERTNGVDRRKALETLAVELDASGRPQLAEDARTLAWSAASPSPVAADALVSSVREADDTNV